MRRSERIVGPDVVAGVAQLRARVEVLTARREQLTRAQYAALDSVSTLLTKADRAARGVEPPYRRVVSWWNGLPLELAYEHLHAARVELIEIYDEREIEAVTPLAVARSRRALDRDDPRLEHIERIPVMRSPTARRLAVRDGLRIGYSSMRGWHRQRRRFRNAVYLAATGTAVLVALLVALGVWRPEFLPFCFDTVSTVPGGATGPGDTVTALRTTNCPSGSAAGRRPHPADIMIVALLGLVGGALAATVSIRGMTGTASPYRLAGALAALKVPTGAIAAVAGLIAIRGNFVPGLSALDSQEQILAYALVFGYAQQLATGLLDRRARALAKDEPAEHVTAPPAPIHPGPADPDRPDAAATAGGATASPKGRPGLLRRRRAR